jgi:hypothetical protein
MLEISDEIETLNWQGIFDQNNFNPLRSLKANEWMQENMFKFYPKGDLKDTTK